MRVAMISPAIRALHRLVSGEALDRVEAFLGREADFQRVSERIAEENQETQDGSESPEPAEASEAAAVLTD